MTTYQTSTQGADGDLAGCARLLSEPEVI